MLLFDYMYRERDNILVVGAVNRDRDPVWASPNATGGPQRRLCGHPHQPPHQESAQHEPMTSNGISFTLSLWHFATVCTAAKNTITVSLHIRYFIMIFKKICSRKFLNCLFLLSYRDRILQYKVWHKHSLFRDKVKPIPLMILVDFSFSLISWTNFFHFFPFSVWCFYPILSKMLELLRRITVYEY